MEKERFRSAAIEDERVAPLQAGDRLAFTRFLDDEIADGFLFHRLRRGNPHIDLLGAGARVRQQLQRDQMIVEHDVGRGEASQASQGNKPGIAGTGADDVNGRQQYSR